MRNCVALLLAISLVTLAACGGGDSNPAPRFNRAANVGGEAPAQPGGAQNLWKHEKSLERGVRHILDTQKKKGDWGYMGSRPYDIYLGSLNSLHVFGNASSALCLMALLKQQPNKEIDRALLRGYGYLVDMGKGAPDTPRATGNTFYNIWAHIYMLQALSAGMGDSRFTDLHKKMKTRAVHEMRRLLMHQSLNGGWGYYDFRHRTLQPSGDLSTSFSTAAALIALKESMSAGIHVQDHRVQIALEFLVRQRVPNGAYIYSDGHKYRPLGTANLPRGSLGRSQAGNNALFEWNKVVKAEDLQKGMDYFFKDHQFIEMGRTRQFPHEAWYATAPYYYYFGHYYASRNVGLLATVEKRNEAATKLADLIVKTQTDDGSFWDYPLYGYTKAYGTGYGVLILSNCKEQLIKDTG